MLQPKLPIHNFWKLIDILDSETKISKVHTKALYGSMINCVTTSFSYDEKSESTDSLSLNIEFLYKERQHHTSSVKNIIEEDFKLSVHTLNSIYIFEKVEKLDLPKPKNNLINCFELYMSEKCEHFFKAGFYYDFEGTAVQLKGLTHIGSFTDSVLLMDSSKDILLRYFIHAKSIEFYKSIFINRKWDIPIIIHNEGKENFIIKCERLKKEWIISPGVSETIDLEGI